MNWTKAQYKLNNYFQEQSEGGNDDFTFPYWVGIGMMIFYIISKL